MRAFAFGVVVTIAVKLLGWDTITSALDLADDAARSAYDHAETQAAHMRAKVARERAARGGE